MATSSRRTSKHEHVPSDQAIMPVWGEMGMEAIAIWDALREGEHPVLKCQDCEKKLRVSLTVELL